MRGDDGSCRIVAQPWNVLPHDTKHSSLSIFSSTTRWQNLPLLGPGIVLHFFIMKTALKSTPHSCHSNIMCAGWKRQVLTESAVELSSKYWLKPEPLRLIVRLAASAQMPLQRPYISTATSVWYHKRQVANWQLMARNLEPTHKAFLVSPWKPHQYFPPRYGSSAVEFYLCRKGNLIKKWWARGLLPQFQSHLSSLAQDVTLWLYCWALKSFSGWQICTSLP